MPNYPYYGYQPYQPYQPPMADQLMQLRQSQYQPNMQQGFQQTQQPAQPTIQSMIWVNGLNDAKNYLIAPNSAVALWDSTSPCIYLKQADASGKPSLKTFDLVERVDGETKSTETIYATKEELGHIQEDLEKIKGKISSLQKTQKAQKEESGGS